ncbi:uncharacterized protein LOC131150843 isoform X2 [Malania oleifera]|uniref:uncharacterized protein LOC131150843 isoform X2 n=1 Tax=Malania oleifera TaxID=397392 RepID=UPI0025ADEECB|nr:uncharacterized protein LOC131150843 isoform X2 [Malania oleifera]
MTAEKWTVKKPSRSDEVVEAEKQLRIADQVRTHFNSVAPKRPAKPNRSESDPSNTSPDVGTFDGDIPEFHKFQSLQSQSQCQAVISAEGGATVQEEFVETQYYKELDSVDKQHHTTGSGFIKVVKESSENGYDLHLQGGGRRREDGGRVAVVPCFRSNPATNDWIPAVEEGLQVIHVSSKPNRSEGS